jgi:hypothetical protein
MLKDAPVLESGSMPVKLSVSRSYGRDRLAHDKLDALDRFEEHFELQE